METYLLRIKVLLNDARNELSEDEYEELARMVRPTNSTSAATRMPTPTSKSGNPKTTERAERSGSDS